MKMQFFPNKKAAAEKAGSAPTVAATDALTGYVPEDNSELIAVITAAIAAFEGSAAMSGLVVRKISRISGETTAWSSAGLMECIDSRRR